MNNTPAFHSEINDLYVSNPYPSFGETVTVRLRVPCAGVPEGAAASRRVLLRRLENGTNVHMSMRFERSDTLFDWYACDLRINQKNVHWHFIIIQGTETFYYTRKSVTRYPPTEDHDFVLITDFENPDWVPRSVFYQIFVDRFRNGNPANDVENGSYVFDGHPTRKNEWGSVPPEYSEAHCLDFYGGDLEGVRDMIPWFKEIGVNALYLNPIFSARTNHKYDCIDYFSVDEAFGGGKALKDLTDALHEAGMRVLVDVSINHTGSDHPWYRTALENPSSSERSYYYFDDQGSAKKWRGVESLPQLNYGSQELRGLIFENNDSLVRKYISEYGIDGWRFDVAMDTGRNDRDQLGNDIFARVRSRTKELKKDCYLIGEHWKDNISYLLGDQLDGMMNYFASSRPLRTFAGETERYLVGDGIPLEPGTGITTGTDLAAQILQHYARLPNQIAFLQFNLIDSHDIHRLHNNQAVHDFGVYSGIVMFMYLLPGTPNVYYGDEIGLAGRVDTVEACRYPMEWDRSKHNTEFYNLYTKLSHLKQAEKALQCGSMRIVYADDDVCALARWYDETAFVAILAKNAESKTLALPLSAIGAADGSRWTDALALNGGHFAGTVRNGFLDVTIGVRGSVLLRGTVLKG